MKTKLAIILTLVLNSWIIIGQNQIKFRHSSSNDTATIQLASEAQDANTNVFLYVEGQEKRPTAKFPIRIAQEGLQKWYADYAKMLQTEFPEVNDEMYEVLKGINWSIYVFPNGSCQHYFFRVPQKTLQTYPKLEKHLANLVVALKKIDFTQYQMEFVNPNEKENHLGIFTFSFKHIR